MSLAHLIAQKRKEKGLTQSELAQLLGVNQSIIARWESGQVKPRPKMFEQLSEALETSIDELAREEADGPALAQSRPALKELLLQLPQLADYQIEALRVVVSDMLTRGQMESLLKR